MSSNMVLTKSPEPFAVMDRANLAETTKRHYKRALRRYFRETGIGPKRS